MFPSGIINPTVNQYLDLLKSGARSVLNLQFPREFEAYLMAFELVNSSGDTTDYFIFPIMPESIEENESPILSVNKTLKGVSILKNNTYNPRNISLSGSFGVCFKFLIGRNKKIQSEVDGVAFYFGQREASKEIKTGYGCIKLLEAMFLTLTQKDQKGGAYRLNLYNLAFGSSYVVEVLNYSFRQSLSQNSIWTYSISLQSVAPLEAVLSKENYKENVEDLVKWSFVNKGVSITTSLAKEYLNTALIR